MLNPLFVAFWCVKSAEGGRFRVEVEVNAPWRATYSKVYSTQRAARCQGGKIARKAFSCKTEGEARMVLNAWREEVRNG